METWGKLQLRRILFCIGINGAVFAGLGFLLGTMSCLAEAQVESQSPLMSPEEIKTLEKARKRSFPGGRDEESLKVQTQLPVPNRKMAPATEAPAETGAVAPAASDD